MSRGKPLVRKLKYRESGDLKRVDNCNYCGRPLPKKSKHHFYCERCWKKLNFVTYTTGDEEGEVMYAPRQQLTKGQDSCKVTYCNLPDGTLKFTTTSPRGWTLIVFYRQEKWTPTHGITVFNLWPFRKPPDRFSKSVTKYIVESINESIARPEERPFLFFIKSAKKEKECWCLKELIKKQGFRYKAGLSAFLRRKRPYTVEIPGPKYEKED